MRIEDRMSMWAAKRPRDEVSELLLEGAQEIADLRRHREEDGEQMSALISGYQKMQGLCIDGKYLTDDEKQAIEYYIGTGGPYSVDCTLIALLDRMRSGALTTCETVSQNGDCPVPDNAAKQDNTPAAHATQCEGSEQNGCTLAAEVRRLRAAITALADQDATLAVQGGSVIVTMDATLTVGEREAVEWFARVGHSDDGGRAATLRGLLERLGGGR